MAPPVSRLPSALASLAAAARAAGPPEPALGCLRWQGLGCDAVTDEDACLGSRDGRPWRQWEGYRLSGEPCAWCGGRPCAEGSDALCVPRDWARDAPGAAVANCSAGFVVLPEGVVLTDGSATEAGAPAGEFEEGVGGEGFRCTAEYGEESKEFNDLFFTFTAPKLEACKAICVVEDYCAGVEFVADGLACRVWWHAISAVEPAEGHSCARRAPRASTDLTPISSSEARARAAAKEAAEAAAAEEARQQEEEANATARAAAIGGGIAGGVAGAGLLAGLLGGLLGQTTATVTTTVLLAGRSATTADNRTLADIPVDGTSSGGHWVPFVVLLFLSCVALLLLLVRTRSKTASRSATLEREGESPSGRAEAGAARGLARQQETFLRWPEWSRHLSQYEGVAASDVQESPWARWSLLARAPLGSLPLAPPSPMAHPSGTGPVRRQVERVALPVEPTARCPAFAEPLAPA